MAINIYNCDCMDYMRNLPDKSYDMAIVDPPFGIGEWWMKRKSTSHYGRASWNDSKPGPEYFKELFRISKEQIIWGGNYFTDILPVSNSWLIWDKVMNESPNSDCELAWTSLKIKMTKITVAWSGAIKDESNFKRIHPCQRPVKLHHITLQKFVKPGFRLFDSHLGSGSIAIACYDAGIDLDACEINQAYCVGALERLEQHKLQLQFDFTNQPAAGPL